MAFAENFERRSSWRPPQLAPAEQMHMQVEYALPGSGPHIEHRTIPAFDLPLPRKLGCHNMSIAHIHGILRPSFLETPNMTFGDDEHMGGRLRIDVLKCIRVLILVNFFGRYLSLYDSAK